MRSSCVQLAEGANTGRQPVMVGFSVVDGMGNVDERAMAQGKSWNGCVGDVRFAKVCTWA